MAMDMLSMIRDAGVVGAGGAGFPTHVKLACQAEYVIANGAECEPLLRVDQQVMEMEAQDVVAGLKAEMELTGAQQGVIFLKEHYTGAIAALTRAIAREKQIRLHIVNSFYPAGDEQQIIYEVARRVVPPGGLPKDVGCVVNNVSTLVNVARALRGESVTDKYVTVGGAVRRPCTVRVPIGTPLSVLLEHAGGTLGDCVLLMGGPCMGPVAKDADQPVTKTTGGLLAIPKDHPLLERKSTEINLRVMQSVCCQCSMCTQMCPRNALGLGTSPHKAMRAVASGADLVGDVAGIFSCCDCGVCTYYACNFGLKPSHIMKLLKGSLMQKGLRPNPDAMEEPDRYLKDKRLPTARLIARLGLEAYDVPAPLEPELLECRQVRIPTKMHVGAPGRPVVSPGDRVSRGQLLLDLPEKGLGAKIHASIDGTVTAVTESYIEVRA